MTHRDYTRQQLIYALQQGPQSVRPPSLHALSKSDLWRSVNSALVQPQGNPVRAAMEQALDFAADYQ